MQFNWIDWIIFFVVLYHVIDGWDKGLMSLLSNTIAFLASLFIAIRFHTQVGGFLVATFGLPQLWTSVLGYLVLAFPLQPPPPLHHAGRHERCTHLLAGSSTVMVKN